MDWIPVGKVTKTHGLKGELKFYPLMDENWFADLKQVRLGNEDPAKDFTDCTLQSLRGKDVPLIVKFKEVDDVDAAKQLAGMTLYVPRDAFPELPEDEYYWFQIEGLEVYDEDARYYGRVEEIIRTGSNDVYVVRDDKKELLLPMIDSVVKSIDLEAGKLIFHPVEGLLEDTPV
ncbi:ribosome maturation factor RimM [Candidatus Nitromaritima sp. SCGC AAA799-C22]|nr:ribosome maturation factor RimM [Candidatus Nitromaritima sp. SCGC AAA799-C22]